MSSRAKSARDEQCDTSADLRSTFTERTARGAGVIDTDGGRPMRLRYPGKCRLCGIELPAGSEAIWERADRTVRCLDCAVGAAGTEPDPTTACNIAVPDSGKAGSSARREYTKRSAKREVGLRARHPRIGALILAVTDEPQSTRAWERGAVGEERLGARLDTLAAGGVSVLHDRRIPGTRANIDHIAVTTSGVWVIDAKRYRGRPELRIEGGILRPRVERMFVGGRACTNLVDGILKQVDLVRAAAGQVPVRGALCFVEADWPLLGGSFTTRGIHALWPQRLTELLLETPAGPVDVSTMQRLLAQAFPPA